MAVGTVRGRIELDAPALRKLKELERQGIRTNAQMEALGKTMDRVGGRYAQQRLERYRREVRDLGRTTMVTHRQMRREWNTSERHIIRSVTRQTFAVRDLRREVEKLGKTRVQGNVDVAGIDEALGKVELLHSRLNALGRERATPRVGLGGLAGGVGGGGGGLRAPRTGTFGGGGGAGGGRGLRSIGFGPFNLGSGLGLGLIGAALPAVSSLVGATGALAGTLGLGAAGAGALGVTGGGALAAGIGSLVAVAKPATNAISEANKAQQKYNDTLRDFGRSSTQAKNAKRELDQAMQAAPRGTRQLLRDFQALSRVWRRETRPGQEDFVAFLGGATRDLRRFAPTAAGAGNRSAAAVRREGGRLSRFATGSVGRRFARGGARIFDENLGNVRQTFEGAAEAATNVMIASRPFFRESTRWLARWTGGWADGTRDIEKTRREVGVLFEHLKSIGRLGGAGWELIKDLLVAGAPAGKTMVERMTRQLERWDDWINRNPAKVRRFFRESVDETGKLARAFGQIVKVLAQFADRLQPILDGVATLTTLLGGAGLLQPGAGALAFGAFRGARGGGGGGGGLGGGGGGPALIGGAAGYGAARGAAGARGAGAARAGVAGRTFLHPGTGHMVPAPGWTPGGPVSQLGRRTGRIGRFAGGASLAARGAGRAYLPVGAALAILDAAGFQGSAGGRFQAALSGATLGAVPRPTAGPEWEQKVFENVQRRVEALPNAPGRQGEAIATLRRQIGTGTDIFQGLSESGFLGVGGGGATNEQKRTGIKLLKEELALRKDIARTYRTERIQERNQQSREHGRRLTRELGEAYSVRERAGVDPTRNFTRTNRDALEALRRMRPAGAKILGENVLAWGREMARKNPALTKQVDALERSIKRSFSRTGQHVSIVNGKILTGSRREWENIRTAMSSRAEKARQEVTAAFTAIQRQAVGSLTAMGFSASEARRLVQGMESGGRQGRAAKEVAGGGAGFQAFEQAKGGREVGGVRYPNANRNRARGGRLAGFGKQDTVGMADGGYGAPGELVFTRHQETFLDRLLRGTGWTADRVSKRVRTPHTAPIGGPARADSKARTLAPGQQAGGAALMGAKPGLAVYADIGKRYGLRVSSGLRSGAVTSSGNVSLHASGDAIDQSGSAAGMLHYTRFVSRNYGPGLDELIYTPAGRAQIKAGQSYVYGGQVAADHFDHVHTGDRTPGGGARGSISGAGVGAGGAIRLRGRRSRLGGVPGAMSTRASQMYAAGLEKRVNDAIGDGAVGTGGFAGGGTPNANMRLGRRMMLAFGFPGGEWSSLRTLGQIESGWNQNARNPSSGAQGIPQALGHGDIGSDPGGQIAWMLRYIKGRYGTPSNALAFHRSHGYYGRGGRMKFAGAFAGGGSFMTDGPTAFVAGERGRERVRVSPARRAGVGGFTVQVSFGDVTVRSKADIDDLAERVGSRVGEKILAALEGDAVPDGAIA